jgi:tRNA(Ile2) C34 agmatinyltransferase TiaS
MDDESIHGDIRKQYLDDETKLKRHRKSYRESKPVVFCVRCGSTTVDQNSPNELRCYECGTTISWNCKKFSIRRSSGGEYDVISAFKEAKK